MIKIIANAKFPAIKPAHHAFITKHGQGSSLAVACRDAIQNIIKDDRLKGRKAANIAPFTVTFSTYKEVQNVNE